MSYLKNMKIVSLSIVIILVAGCKVASNMYYAELEQYDAEMRIESNELIIKLNNPPGLMVYEIEHKQKGGNIYLVARRISSGGGTREYKIRLSLHTVPSDIQEHIFWVNPDASVTQLYPEYLK